MDECIDVFDKKFTEEGWCKVDHQSTENFIMGTLITPKIAIIEVILKTVSWFEKILQDTKYIK